MAELNQTVKFGVDVAQDAGPDLHTVVVTITDPSGKVSQVRVAGTFLERADVMQQRLREAEEARSVDLSKELEGGD